MDFKILHGCCKEHLASLIENKTQVDSIITDPPYELGFMGKSWDNTGIAYDVEMWKLCLAVLKPGGHLLSFGGSRTYHRMACAIEDAGFQIRDQIMWVYGSGFPKSLNISKQIDKMAGAEREVIGVTTSGKILRSNGQNERPYQAGKNRIECAVTTPTTTAAKQWDGFGTALKPAHEPIVLARKPLSEKNIASNVLKHGVGGLNIDECRVGDEERVNPAFGIDGYRRFAGREDRMITVATTVTGRFPANLIHDGSEEQFNKFFYCAKASTKERNGSNHPTVKPLSLMRYLCRLVTPPSGVILDPFAGSGTTLEAAKLEGFSCIAIEKEISYLAAIEQRLTKGYL